MLQLRVTPKAESDLTDIWTYSCEKWGITQANAYLDRLEIGMKQLLNHSLLGVNCSHVLADYRKLQIEHHAVFYKVLERELLVIRVLNEDMDAPQRLLD